MTVFSLRAAAHDRIDSLYTALRNSSDTSRVHTLLNLAGSYLSTHQDSTIHFGHLALKESIEISFEKGKAAALIKIADGHYFKKDFATSIEFLLKASEVYRESGDNNSAAECLNKIGINYNRLGNYSDAKKYSQEALEIFGDTDNLEGQWKCFSNLGIIAKEVGDLRMSLHYNLESLKITEVLGDAWGKTKVLTNIGNTYSSLDDHTKALEYYQQALTLADSLNNKQSMALLKNNIATCYQINEEYHKAGQYYKESLDLKEQMQDYPRMAVSLNNIGFNYIELKEYSEAENSFRKALRQPHITEITKSNSYNGLARLAMLNKELKKAEDYALKSYSIIKEIHHIEQLKYSTETLYEVYEAQKNFEKALHYLKLFEAYEDSLVNEDKLREIGKLEAKYEFGIREQKRVAEQLQQELEANIALSNQRILTYSASAAFLVMFIAALFIFRSKQQKKKANVLLSEKNKKIHRQKEKIEIQAEKLSQLNQIKDRLFMIISHDLRNPLQSLKMLLDMALKHNLSEADFKKYLPTLSKDVGYTSGLLNNLLHWTYSQMKGETIVPENFDLREISLNLLHVYTKQAEFKKIEVINDIKEPLPVFADKNMVELVLRNLVSNAIKFSGENDRIILSALHLENEVEVCVSDTGVGISQENLKKLFGENFSTRGTENEKGTGLGLMLCKEFIEKNGGQMRVTSTLGKGSKFYFSLPAGNPSVVSQDRNIQKSLQ